MLNVAQLKKGTVVKINNQPYVIMSADHSHAGRGGSVLKTKLKNLITGATKDETFRGADNVEEADITKAMTQYLYHDENYLYFMALKDYEQMAVPITVGKNMLPYLTEGLQVNILCFEQKPATIELPAKVDLKVITAGNAVKGNTAQGNAYKEVTLESNATFSVPLFIKEGDIVRINTDTGEYVERV